MEHNHPPGNSLKALVDVKLLVNTLKSHETLVGEWVNVMGYIEHEKKPKALVNDANVRVQALVLWSSGPFNVEAYQKTLDRAVTEAANQP